MLGCVCLGCNFFACDWQLPAYNGAFLLTVVFGESLYLQLELSHLQLELLCLQLELFAYGWKARPISTLLMDCKQGTSTVSKKAPAVSKKLPRFK